MVLAAVESVEKRTQIRFDFRRTVEPIRASIAEFLDLVRDQTPLRYHHIVDGGRGLSIDGVTTTFDFPSYPNTKANVDIGSLQGAEDAYVVRLQVPYPHGRTNKLEILYIIFPHEIDLRLDDEVNGIHMHHLLSKHRSADIQKVHELKNIISDVTRQHPEAMAETVR